jgi:hypothetical protein
MKKNIFFILLLVTQIIFISCENNPLVYPEVQPGRRDYVWTVDTISIFSNYIQSIWGSSPDDIWGVGPGGALNTTIWHYNGTEWKTDEVSRAISPWCIFGFSKNDVWIAGLDGKVWHYDGKNWMQNYQHDINGFTGIDIYDLYGINNHDLYAAGAAWFNNETRRGIILHYDGNKWEQEYLADFNSLFMKIRVNCYKKCFINCIKQDIINNSADTTLIYEYDEKRLTEIYSDENVPYFKGGWMTIINGELVLSLRNGIFTYDNNELVPIIKYDSQTLPGAIFGRNKKDIFISTSEGLSHYDGTDIQPVFTGLGWPNDGILFDKEVFFLNTTLQNGESLVYHGKLK